MLFQSQVFTLGFLPPVLAAYYLAAGSPTARKLLLVTASVVFYAWWDWRFVPLLAGLATATWLIARALQRARGTPSILVSAGLLLNLGALIAFKYTDFLGENLDWAIGRHWTPLLWVLPLGISFFVFQKISYLLDLRRGARHFYGFLDFCLFVSFFPQLVAGPIVRHDEIIPQFAADPRGPAAWQNLARGLVLFAIGLTKKLAIADSLAPVVDPLFAGAALTPPGALAAWTAAVAYALQIYFDFSGYSDMAIGLARMFGLVLPENFAAPYRARSIRDFWRRWHITLSRLLRDYLYIPLGGNRAGPWRQALNVLVTMLIGGLWHGANWTFVLWGGLHGAALALNAAWHRTGLGLPAGMGWALTMLFLLVCWVLFRAPDFTVAGHMLGGMIGMHGRGPAPAGPAWPIVLGAAVALLGPTSQQAALIRLRPQPWLAVPIGLALTGLVLLSGGRLQTAFIYFQF